jgi:hypothetical protein
VQTNGPEMFLGEVMNFVNKSKIDKVTKVEDLASFDGVSKLEVLLSKLPMVPHMLKYYQANRNKAIHLIKQRNFTKDG